MVLQMVDKSYVFKAQ